MSEKTKTSKRLMSREIAPEDIRAGHYVAPLYMNLEVLSESALSDSSWRAPRPAMVRILPWIGHPVRALDVCLPFVLVRDTDGDLETIDTRRWRLARVSQRFGKTVFERVKAKKRRDKKRESDDD
ncbi:MAG: hypothetical protein KDA32_05645 [Phycisphaerales bacterium]|nr:hypothetical protein [Phycisphaerales bacterium]